MFEEYMRDVLGYSPINNLYNQHIPNDNIDANLFNNNMMQYNLNMQQNLNNMYPEIYNIVYPMIKSACMKNTGVITETMINQIVDDIANNLEPKDTNINIKDLIKILLIRELTGCPGYTRGGNYNYNQIPPIMAIK